MQSFHLSNKYHPCDGDTDTVVSITVLAADGVSKDQLWHAVLDSASDLIADMDET